MPALVDSSVDFAMLRRLHDHIGRVNRCRSLGDTLQAVVEGVVDVVGFEVAAISYVHLDKTFEVLAVAGSASAREELLGRRRPADAYDHEFALADHWGNLRFVPHERLPGGEGQGWVPDIELVDGPDAWHPHDALFAPLSSPGGDLVGMLSVDLPRDRRRPGLIQRQFLELFAAQAGIAIDNARLSEQLQASVEAFRLAFEGAGNGMALISLSAADCGRYLRVNAALCRIVGRSEAELLALRLADVTHPDDRDAEAAALECAAGGGTAVHQAEKRYLHADGHDVWVAVTASAVQDTAGGAHYLIVQIEDISDRRAAREELTHRVGHDDLTGLPNRHTLRQQLAATVADGDPAEGTGALLFCDLNGFKKVNDTYGHAAGDRVLIVIAQRLAGASRRGDIVARLGGDEFVVLAQATTPQKAAQLAERLRRAVASPVVIDQVLLRLSVSIGIAYTRESSDPDELLRRADADMYRVKTARYRERAATMSSRRSWQQARPYTAR